MPRECGHVQGAKVFRRIVKYYGDIGIEIVTVYALSTEVAKRPKSEINAILNLFESIWGRRARRAQPRSARCFIGDRSIFSPDGGRMSALERMTQNREASERCHKLEAAQNCRRHQQTSLPRAKKRDRSRLGTRVYWRLSRPRHHCAPALKCACPTFFCGNLTRNCIS